MAAILDTNNTNHTPPTPTSSSSTMPAPTTFPIKLRVGRTVRRTTLPSTTTWSDLLDVTTQLFGPTTLDLHAAQTDGATYLDEDGDLISLSSTHELQEALKCADQLRRDLTLMLPAADEGMNGAAWGVPGASFVGSSNSGSSSRASSVIMDLDGPVLEEICADEEDVTAADKVSVDAVVTEDVPAAAPVDEPATAVEMPKVDDSVPTTEDSQPLVDPAQVPLSTDTDDETVTDVPQPIAHEPTRSEDVEMRDAMDGDDAVLEAAMTALNNDEEPAQPAPAAKDQPIRNPAAVIPNAPLTPSPCYEPSSTTECSAPRATLTLGDLLSELFDMPALDQKERDQQRAAAAQRQAQLEAERRHRAALLDAERRRRAAILDAEHRRRATVMEAKRKHRLHLQQLSAHQAAALERQRQQQAYARAIALQRQREYVREMAIRSQQEMAARHQAGLARAVREYERAMAEVPMMMMSGGCPFVPRPSRVAMPPMAGPLMMMFC
ncbi:hypothetical protein AMAG_13129 [Allomyces macrogynus ATCC 38327]|uniref:PB1 domain-containing protein n=1 Tax=Allomyces macrogynus (strain ATCC 38327) TaxID=578462 RepID=A0A0L0SZH0_ALLM3|nr:hypothetical protein AMAG_13129 [Allomyces macrogynus ATCC 38327]|eukprot:KNE67943.1 hypothetical protein AMAG_13129 [Allomyces macrogynus ATCC 38327]